MPPEDTQQTMDGVLPDVPESVQKEADKWKDTLKKKNTSATKHKQQTDKLKETMAEHGIKRVMVTTAKGDKLVCLEDDKKIITKTPKKSPEAQTDASHAE